MSGKLPDRTATHCGQRRLQGGDPRCPRVSRARGGQRPSSERHGHSRGEAEREDQWRRQSRSFRRIGHPRRQVDPPDQGQIPASVPRCHCWPKWLPPSLMGVEASGAASITMKGGAKVNRFTASASGASGLRRRSRFVTSHRQRGRCLSSRARRVRGVNESRSHGREPGQSPGLTGGRRRRLD